MKIWISDFGLSKKVLSGGFSEFSINIISETIKSHQSLGTLGYMAPELYNQAQETLDVFLKHKNTSKEELKKPRELNYLLCDLYSVGVLINELLTEKAPNFLKD